MKKTSLINLFLCLVLSSGYAQQSTSFRKIIENNSRDDFKYSEGYGVGIPPGSYNFKSKTETEKLFFGDINADVEYFMSPSFEGPTGLRIIKDSTGSSYFIETKNISNWKETEKLMSEKYPSIGIPGKLASSMPENIRELTRKHNNEMYRKQKEEELRHYTIETHSSQVSNLFAEKLYAKFVSLIENFMMKGRPALIGDGYNVTFRCVVGDDVWTLTIQCPEAENVLKLADLCNRIIADVEAGAFDETKYIGALDN